MSRSPRVRKARPGLAAIIAVAVLAGVPAGVAYSLSQASDPLQDKARVVTPVYAEAQFEPVTIQKSGQLKLKWLEGGALSSPGFSGIVSAVLTKPGELLASGDPIMEIDGQPVLTLHTEGPLWRSLGPGSTGADVLMLNNALDQLGFAHGESKWDSRTTQGVKQFQEDLMGFKKSQLKNSFDPSWVVWMPQPQFEIGKVTVVPGTPAPGIGEVLLEEAFNLVGAEVTDVEGQPLELVDTTQWKFTSHSDDIVLALDNGSVTDDVLPELRKIVNSSQETLGGEINSLDSAKLTKVPTTSVLSTLNENCIWTKAIDGNGPVPMPVTVVHGTVEATFLSEEIDNGNLVLANPLGHVEVAECN